jgi:hypothetical protein
LPEINSAHFECLVNQTARYKNNIANARDFVNMSGQLGSLNRASPGEMSIRPNHTAERLWQIPARLINQIDSSFLEDRLIVNTLAKTWDRVNLDSVSRDTEKETV